MERHYPQDPPNVKRYIIYGDAYIDLGAISSLAHNQIHKASSIRIIDDGYPDVMGTGGLSNMLVELIPQTVSLQKIEIYHMALTCSASQPCPTQNDIAGMQLQPMNIP
jgi:hypothetical protein